MARLSRDCLARFARGRAYQSGGHGAEWTRGGKTYADDGNNNDGDCCSATCTFESAGNPCEGDFDACTRGECDGMGFCNEPCGGGVACPAQYCNTGAPCGDDGCGFSCEYNTTDSTCLCGGVAIP